MTTSEWHGQWAGDGPDPRPQQQGHQHGGPVPPQQQAQPQWQAQPQPGQQAGWQGAVPRPQLAPVAPGQPPAPGNGILVLNTKPVMLSGFLTSPGVTINGHPVAAKWGETAYQLPAGQYHVAVKVNYIFPFGDASTPVQIVPGQAATVYYAAPNGVFFSGAIGFEPQKNPGLWITWAALGVVLFLVVLMFVLIAIAAMS